MLVKFGENECQDGRGSRGCATDDLVGWTERKDGETVKHAGYLDGFEISREDAEALIMQARVKAGLDHRSRSRQAVGRGGSLRREPGVTRPKLMKRLSDNAMFRKS
jgi:hypothetical protein